MGTPDREPIRFGGFELDVAAYELRRDGRPVRLERQPLDLLILLVERAGTLVTREDIAARLWGPDVFVDVESGVNTAVRKVRQALRDPSDTPQFVVTVPGKGYRFAAAISREEADPVSTAHAGTTPGEPAPAAAPGTADAPGDGASSHVPHHEEARARRTPARRTGLVAVATVLGLALVGLATWLGVQPARRPGVRVAVLPFTWIGPDASRAYLADGVTRELAAMLGQLDPSHIMVIDPASVRGAQPASARDLARDVGATHFVDGVLQAERERLRVTARLLRSADGAQVWAGTFDRLDASLLAVQSELSLAIAHRVEARLTPERRTGLADRQTSSDLAYELYLKGLHLWGHLRPDTNVQALEAFRQAVAIDPEYSLAWAAIAVTLTGSTINGDGQPAVVRPRVAEALGRATRRPAGAEVSFARGMMAFMLDRDWPAAEEALRRAIHVDPSHVLATRLLAHVLSQRGAHDEADALMARARTLDPRGAMTWAVASQLAYQARNHTRALDLGREAVRLAPGLWVAHLQVAQAADMLGQASLAAEAADAAVRLSGGNSKARALAAALRAQRGEQEQARATLTAMQHEAQQTYVPPYALALLQLVLGEHEDALASLAHAVEVGDVHLVFLTVDPRWDALRADERFARILARSNLPRVPQPPAR